MLSVWKLRLSMIGTLAIIFGLSTLVFTIVLMLFGGSLGFIAIGVFVVIFYFAQWLLSPYLVGAIYKVKELKPNDNPQVYQMVKELSAKSKMSMPKVMLAQIALPNAFAYGSPLTGNRVAVTQGLLNSLDKGEIEAVIGHELGHLKHRDVQVMMTVSFLPTLFFYIGYSLMLSGIFGGRNRNNGGSNALIGIAFIAFSWLLNLFTLSLSRLREYYADRHSVAIVENGATKLSTGLVTIVNESKNHNRFRRNNTNRQNQQKNNSSFKTLFISDPDSTTTTNTEEPSYTNTPNNKQALLNEFLSKKITGAEKFAELFSTHPNITKRLRALQTQT